MAEITQKHISGDIDAVLAYTNKYLDDMNNTTREASKAQLTSTVGKWDKKTQDRLYATTSEKFSSENSNDRRIAYELLNVLSQVGNTRAQKFLENPLQNVRKPSKATKKTVAQRPQVDSGYLIKHGLTKALCYFFLVVLLLICVVPVYMLLINATRTTPQIQQGFSMIPGTSFLDNWQTLSALGIDVWLGIRNSSIVAFSSTFLTVYFSLLTAYAIIVYDFKFKNAMFVFILAMIMVPGQLYLIGFYQYMHALGLLNSFVPLIVPAIAAPGAVFFFKQYLDASISHELIQAARIDGASEFGIFNRIALPMALPGAFTMGIFSFVGSWNAFMGPLFLLGGNPDLHTLPLLLDRLQGDTFRRDLGAIYFGMAFTLIPILIVYFAFSKFIITGISLGAVKE